jgi:cation transport ATPase
MKISSVMRNKPAALLAPILSSGAVILLTISSAFAGQQTIQVELDGLVCAFCAQGVEKKMKAQAATDKVFVSLNKKVTLVALKEGQDIPDETIKSEITNAGYVVKGISRTSESFDQLRAKIKASK